MPHVFTRPRAEADLVDIWRYIAQDSPANADRMLDRIDETMNRLAAMPFMGQARFDLAPGLRMFPVGNYLIEGFNQVVMSISRALLYSPL
jgi:toxin ParE1/3/4